MVFLFVVWFWFFSVVIIVVLIFFRLYCVVKMFYRYFFKIRNYFLTEDIKLKIIDYVFDLGNIVNDFCVDFILMCFFIINGILGYYFFYKLRLCFII